MLISHKDLTIRNATAADAELLCAWWNDGKVMAHAGFPNGLNTTAEKIRGDLAAATADACQLCIIELKGEPIGEMNYRNKGDGTAQIGIKICVFTQQEKGLGTILLSMFIDALFNDYGYEKIILDTNTNNKRAQHVYEKKLGFKVAGIREQSWRNQLGIMQGSIDYELTKADWHLYFKGRQSYGNNTD